MKTKPGQTDTTSSLFPWINASAPATTVGKALQRDAEGKNNEFAPLEAGIAVSKVTNRGVFKQRIATISKDRYGLFVTPKSMDRGHGVLSGFARKLPLPFITRSSLLGFSNPQKMREQFVRYIDVADIDYVSVGCVGSIKLEMTRKGNRLKGEDSLVDTERHTIVTIGHRGNETMDLLIPNSRDRKLLVKCLNLMQATYRKIKVAVSNEALLLRYIWYDVDVDQNGVIGEKEFLKILSRINFHVRSPAKSYRKVLAENEGKAGLTYPQVMTLLQDLKSKGSRKKSMANQVWDEIFGEKEEWVSPKQFLEKFVLRKQGETHANTKDVERLFTFINMIEINVHNEPKNRKSDRSINRYRFEVYLHHQLNSAYDPWSLELDRDVRLRSPLPHYWINTSHNTYLMGDQLQSTSSVEMYMRALRRGCKCLELDVWDGEKLEDGTCIPVVFHGHTLTSKILFADILRGVESYVAQNPGTYPIILSLENHCSHVFQTQMAMDLLTIFGDRLFFPKESDRHRDLPSPESLRGRIVIKGKRPPEPEDGPGEDNTDADYDPYEVEEASPPKSQSSRRESSLKKPKPPAIVKELARLTLFHGTKFKDFTTSIEEPPMHMHSISEFKIPSIVNKKPSNSKQWREYNISHMTRTYPAGTRVDSSNYNPVLAWSLGCQLVALNFQTSDSPLVLNDGVFAQNGGCGYVLKPRSVMLEQSSPEDELRKEVYESRAVRSEILSTEDEEVDPITLVMESFEEVMCGATVPRGDDGRPTQPRDVGITVYQRMQNFNAARKNQSLPQLISVRILSGRCIPKPRGAKTGETIDPYVSVTVHDVKEREDGSLAYVSASSTSSFVNDNGFCPTWNEKKAKDFVIHSPQVAVVQFTLYEKDIGLLDDRVADVAIPVSCLRKGYRSIQLMDSNYTRTGAFGFATLLVHIEQNDIMN